jgi:hypothetical protein
LIEEMFPTVAADDAVAAEREGNLSGHGGLDHRSCVQLNTRLMKEA